MDRLIILALNILQFLAIIIFVEPSLLFSRQNCLQDSKLDNLGRSTRPVRESFYISPSGHFYVHYDTTGINAPALLDDNSNNIPDYVESVGIIADSAYNVLVNIMKYEVEPFDGEGGYDIYIKHYGSNSVYGYNYKENGGSSYLVIDSDYTPQAEKSNFNLSPLKIMEISVCHEYFHGIQWGYEDNLGNNTYFYEMSSMWFEDVIIPDGNDYLDGWVDPLFNNPEADFDDTGDGYELALFGHYLSSYLDPKGLESAKNSTIIREMWERYKSSNSDAFSAIQFVLENNYDITFIETWVDFMTRNLYNGINEDYYYYIDQSLIGPMDIDGIPLNKDTESFILYLNAKSISLASYFTEEIDTMFITHSSDDYVGKIARTNSDLFSNNLYKSLNGTSIITDGSIHLIYGGKNQSSLTIEMYDAYPYDYSLKDVNPNSSSYSSTIKPQFFKDKITLHYFGHQT